MKTYQLTKMFYGLSLAACLLTLFFSFTAERLVKPVAAILGVALICLSISLILETIELKEKMK